MIIVPSFLLTQTLFSCPLHTRFSPPLTPPSHQVELSLRSNRHLPCGLSKKCLVVVWGHVWTCPSGSPDCLSGGLPWELGATLGHDIPLKGKRDKGSAFYSIRTSLSCVELAVSWYSIRDHASYSAQKADFSWFLPMPAPSSPVFAFPLSWWLCTFSFPLPNGIHRHPFLQFLECS